MWLGIAGVLFLLWIIALAFKVTFAAIHLLLVAAIIVTVVGAIRRHAPPTPPGTA